MKVPTLQVPVNLFLDLVRIYKELPQELLNSRDYLTIDMLEKKAYRKYLDYRKQERDSK